MKLNLLKCIIICSFFTVVSCENKECVNIDRTLLFKIQDSNGVDLLNPQSPNEILKDSIQVYYFKNNQKQKMEFSIQSINSNNVLVTMFTEDNILAYIQAKNKIDSVSVKPKSVYSKDNDCTNSVIDSVVLNNTRLKYVDFIILKR